MPNETHDPLRRILLVEDSESDALLLERHLERSGIRPALTRVTSLQALAEELNGDAWDLLISDYRLQGFTGLAVIRMALEKDPDLPCILVSGAIEEEAAVESLRSGARDFVTKQNLSRLIPAVTRELQESEQRRSIRRMEASLKESEERFRAISVSAQDAIVMMDPEGRISFWNPAAERIFGHRQEDALGRQAHEILFPPEHQIEFLRACTHFVSGGTVGKTLETLALRKDGRAIPVELSISGAQFQKGWHGVVIIRDISERKILEAERIQMEIQLRNAQKLEAIGQLAAGIAHEINTPTQYIGDNTIFLQETFRDLNAFLEELKGILGRAPAESGALEALRAKMEALDIDYLVKEIPKAIQQNLEGLARVNTIVAAMKDFSHPGGDAKELVDLNHAIETTVTLSRNEWKYVAELEMDLDPELPKVPCFLGPFNQVILNLIVNASHAIQAASPDHPGHIKISTRCLGAEVVIRVSDTGTGIPEEIRSRIFDPFFTTKPLGKGTGQGLAIAQAVIVDRHAGQIEVESEVGKGTAFILHLPLPVRKGGPA